MEDALDKAGGEGGPSEFFYKVIRGEPHSSSPRRQPLIFIYLSFFIYANLPLIHNTDCRFRKWLTAKTI
jgi:hypothetical protein